MTSNFFLYFDNLILEEKQKQFKFNNKETVTPSNIIDPRNPRNIESNNRHEIRNSGRIGFGPLDQLSEIYKDYKSTKKETSISNKREHELSLDSLSITDKKENKNISSEPLTKKTNINKNIKDNPTSNTKINRNTSNPYLSSAPTSSTRALPVGVTSGKSAAMARLKDAGYEWEEDDGASDASAIFKSNSNIFTQHGDLNKNIQKMTKEATMRQQKVITRKIN